MMARETRFGESPKSNANGFWIIKIRGETYATIFRKLLKLAEVAGLYVFLMISLSLPYTFLPDF